MNKITKVLSIAKFETKKHRTKNEKKVIFVLVLLGLLVYGSIYLFMELGITGDEIFYRFNTEDSTIEEILISTGKFYFATENEADIFIENDNGHIFVFADTTDRGKAAVFSLEMAIKEYNNKIFEKYDEQYAFPLRINIIEIQKEDNSFQDAISASMGLEQESPQNSNDRYIDETTESEKYNEDNDNKNFDTNNDTQFEEHPNNLDRFDDNNILLETESKNYVENQSMEWDNYVSAQEINPFSQFGVLIIVIILTLPLAMISLIYSNSIMSEKINKRGIFLLTAPLNKFEIIIGKTLPYFILGLSIFIPVIIANTSSIRNGLFALIISSVVIISYFAISYMSAMISRSHKELSFISIFFISLYSCYLLIPTFMMNFSLISLASPLTLIAKLFRGEFIGADLLIFSSLPILISSLAIFYAGSKLINDTNMFSYETIGNKIESAIYHIVKDKARYIFWVSFFSIPIIFLIQLMMIVVLLSLGSIFSLFILMFFAALFEEIFKNIAPYTLINKNKKIKIKKIAKYSIYAGLGFFVAEKALLVIMIAPFLEAYSALVLSGLVFPLVMHTIISFIFCICAKYFKYNSFTKSLAVATVVHFLVNLTISLMAIGGYL